jgi:ethanolamine transporter EutH
MILICVFFIIGITDHYLGGRFGIGQEFKRAYGYAGTVISPLWASFLYPPYWRPFSGRW